MFKLEKLVNRVIVFVESCVLGPPENRATQISHSNRNLFPMIITFPSNVFLSFCGDCPLTELTRTENKHLNIFSRHKKKLIMLTEVSPLMMIMPESVRYECCILMRAMLTTDGPLWCVMSELRNVMTTSGYVVIQLCNNCTRMYLTTICLSVSLLE